MIPTFFITRFLDIIIALISLLPSLPQVPTSFDTATDFIITTMAHTASFFDVIYGHALFVGVIFCIVSLYAFESVYKITMWILRKIPLLNIN